ncbi:hypothetical protein AAHA92_33807 [Salvia divinorum]|uniref:Retrotransposon gag domain-containing protein n=1 Tax=Salvia divinorum TaxID=28513 RepID=A0ABD1FGY3_SALDI
MTTSNPGVSRTEPIGDSLPQTIVGLEPEPPLAVIMSQLQRLSAVVGQLESRMDMNDRRVSDTTVLPRPPPAPPFGFSLPSPATIPFLAPAAPTLGQHTHLQSAAIPYLPTQTLGPIYPSLPQTLGPMYAMSAAIPPLSMPSYGFPDGSVTAPTVVRQQQPQYVPWGSDRMGMITPDRTPLQRPQMVNPLSCWGPPGQRPQFNMAGTDQQITKVRMEQPCFDGTDVNNWIRSVQFYFDHMGTPETHRLHYVIMLFDPAVADWIWNYCSSHEYVTWYEFLDDVRRRFDPNCYTSHIGLLKKLTQTGTVSDYQLAFEKLQNNVAGVPDHVLLDLYVAGLRQPIQDEVLLHRPMTLAAAFALALQIASCRPELNQAPSTFPRRNWQPRDNRSATLPPPSNSTSQASPAPVTRTAIQGNRQSNLSKLPIIRLTAAEKADHARRGLCYYCDEKWVSGHVCKHRFLAYMGLDDDEEAYSEVDDIGGHDEVISADLSHLHSADEKRSSKSLSLAGNIEDARVTILIDTGSSHDFLHPRIAEQLRLPLTPVKPFRVYVGNGDSLICSFMSKNTPLSLQGTHFSIDLHILPVHGPDVILGMEWLESLGRVTTDYALKSMEFFRGDELVVLKGLAQPPRQISLASLA